MSTQEIIYKWSGFHLMPTDFASRGDWVAYLPDGRVAFVRAYSYADPYRSSKQDPETNKQTALGDLKAFLESGTPVPNRYMKPSEIVVSMDEWNSLGDVVRLWLARMGAQIPTSVDEAELTTQAKASIETWDKEAIARKLAL